MRDFRHLFQPFKATFASNDVFVVPLDVSGLCQPTRQILGVYLINVGVSGFGGFKVAPDPL